MPLNVPVLCRETFIFLAALVAGGLPDSEAVVEAVTAGPVEIPRVLRGVFAMPRWKLLPGGHGASSQRTEALL